MLSKKQQVRFKKLSREREKWWKNTVPKSISESLNKPTRDITPIRAFCLMKNNCIMEVDVWVSCFNWKCIMQKDGTAAGRVWPTKEGALLQAIVKENERKNKALVELQDADREIGRLEMELDCLLKHPNNKQRKGK